VSIFPLSHRSTHPRGRIMPSAPREGNCWKLNQPTAPISHHYSVNHLWIEGEASQSALTEVASVTGQSGLLSLTASDSEWQSERD
jgi:hypothetical protein